MTMVCFGIKSDFVLTVFYFVYEMVDYGISLLRCSLDFILIFHWIFVRKNWILVKNVINIGNSSVILVFLSIMRFLIQMRKYNLKVSWIKSFIFHYLNQEKNNICKILIKKQNFQFNIDHIINYMVDDRSNLFKGIDESFNETIIPAC